MYMLKMEYVKTPAFVNEQYACAYVMYACCGGTHGFYVGQGSQDASLAWMLAAPEL